MRTRVAEPDERRRGAQLAAREIRDRVHDELRSVGRLIDVGTRTGMLLDLDGFTRGLLDEIDGLVGSGAISPWLRPRIASDDAPLPALTQALRVGIFPVAGNPLHWGHLACALLAIARLRLDTVVIVIAGSDGRKPHLMSEALRHDMARVCLARFEPYLAYSPIARDSDLDGEANLFKLLALNPRQRIDAVYLAGNDHCRRFDPDTGQADTIEKLEHHIANEAFGYDWRMHRVSAAFFEREPMWNMPRSLVPLTLLPGPPIRVSSTRIREAVAAGRSDPVLMALPHALFPFLWDRQPEAMGDEPLLSGALPSGCG